MNEEGGVEGLIRYRLEKSEQAYQDAMLLTSRESWNAVE